MIKSFFEAGHKFFERQDYHKCVNCGSRCLPDSDFCWRCKKPDEPTPKPRCQWIQCDQQDDHNLMQFENFHFHELCYYKFKKLNRIEVRQSEIRRKSV